MLSKQGDTGSALCTQLLGARVRPVPGQVAAHILHISQTVSALLSTAILVLLNKQQRVDKLTYSSLLPALWHRRAP